MGTGDVETVQDATEMGDVAKGQGVEGKEGKGDHEREGEVA